MATHDPQMLKGVLSLLLLRLLAAADGYGYGVVTQLHEAGFPDLVEGTVYPALTRLEAGGHLESYLQRSGSGPARKYYRITESGLAELARGEAAWDQLSAAVAAIRRDSPAAAAGSRFSAEASASPALAVPPSKEA